MTPPILHEIAAGALFLLLAHGVVFIAMAW
jgi:hypothetical protein